MRSQHIWTEKDADGRKREVRVTKFDGVWKFQAKQRNLRDIIFRKYQRRRASAEDLASVEKLLNQQSIES